MARRDSPQADAPVVEQRGVEGVQINGRELHHHANGRFHVARASADVLLGRLDGVVKSGSGWRAKCPACGGGGGDRPLSIAEADDRVLLNCFKCHDADAVLAAVSLSWPDLHPPRPWPQSREESGCARRAIREANLESAIEVLSMEAAVIEVAGHRLQRRGFLSSEDHERLNMALIRVSKARVLVCRAVKWKSGVRA